LNNLTINIVKNMKMNRIFVSFLVVFLISYSLFAQDNNFIKHTVSKGETIYQIATKYKVTPFDIYRLNPDSQAGIKENEVLLIPASILKNVNPETHVVKPKETLYGIARDYNVNVVLLMSINEDLLKDGLKIGQTIKIPSNEGTALIDQKASQAAVPLAVPIVVPVAKKVEAKIPDVKQEKVIYHVIKPKETNMEYQAAIWNYN